MGNTQSARAPATEKPLPAACAASNANASTSQPNECPVKPEYRNPAIFNVYGQRVNDPDAPPTPSNPLQALSSTDLLDPKNNMPLEANQQPCPGQRKLLSVDRAASSIPKGGTAASWLFPSPQMVFNGTVDV
jgi:cytochrome c heme-lyase